MCSMCSTAPGIKSEVEMLLLLSLSLLLTDKIIQQKLKHIFVHHHLGLVAVSQ